MSQYLLYQAPQAKQIISFPITLIDGTKSMKREYASILKVYFEVFQDFNEQERQQFQWTKSLSQSLTFLEDDFGDLTISLKQMLLNLLQFDYPSYVTIILITDGQEPFDYESLQNLILEVKQKYSVQFITILISEKPEHLKIMEALKMLCKSENENQILQYFIQRSKRKNIFEIQNEFREVFNKIKEQLVVYVKKIKINQKVRTLIIQKEQELIDEINPGCLFLADKNLTIKTENDIIKNTTSASHIFQILQSSFLNILKEQADLKVECSEILKVIHDLLSQAESSKDQSDEYQAIKLILQIIKSIINDAFNFQQIDGKIFENIFTAVQSGKINLLKEISMINQSESSVLKINQINQQMIISFGQLLNDNNLQSISFEFFFQLKTIIFKTLQLHEDIFLSEFKYLQNQKDHLNNFIKILKTQLEIVFKKITIDFKDINQIQQLFILNNLIKQLNLIQNECQSQQFLQSLRQLLVKFQENENQQQNEGVLIFYNNLTELGFLQQYNDNFDKDDYQSFFVLLINMNESMNLDKKNFLISYYEGIKEIKNHKRIIIGWNDIKQNGEQMIQEFYLVDEQQQLNNKFTSLFELFEKYKENFRLKQQLINLCILTDDDKNFWRLYLHIKILQISQYHIKQIYIALGLQFMLFLGQEIDKFIKQFVKQQQPLIFNIPKNRSLTLTQKQQGVNKFLIKIFQEIAQKFNQKKL
ncbi:unnamed protein product [Paramecium sonneborni]|uniref:Uncharacterized protein n=1 Tax=Paramecium sonneborni TaxID=65129 RepID=A0A8S1KSS6_9CILI|nr:unnamed protein product [Paramecium sonneborni]